MNKTFVYLLGVLWLTSLVAGTITIDPVRKSYTLGQEAALSFALSDHADFEGIATAALDCGSYTLTYYTSLVELTGNVKKQISLPPLRLLGIMLGSCSFTVGLESFDRKVNEKQTTEKFTVTNQLPLSVTYEDKSYAPGDKVLVKGSIAADEFSGGEVSVTLADTSTQEIKAKEFSIYIPIPKTIKSVGNEIHVAVKDAYGNTGSFKGPITIGQVPSALLLDFNKDTYNPGDAVRIVVKYVDQANETINEPVTLRLYGAKKFLSRDLLYEGKVQDQLFMYQLGLFAPPGEYLIEAEAGNLNKEQSFTINEFKKVDMSLDGSNLKVKNLGNVAYKEDITVKYANTEAELILSVNLKPNESTTYDLAQSMELPREADIGITVETSGLSRTLTTRIAGEQQQGFFQMTGAAIANLPGSSMGTIAFILVFITALAFVIRQRRNADGKRPPLAPPEMKKEAEKISVKEEKTQQDP